MHPRKNVKAVGRTTIAEDCKGDVGPTPYTQAAIFRALSLVDRARRYTGRERFTSASLPRGLTRLVAVTTSGTQHTVQSMHLV